MFKEYNPKKAQQLIKEAGYNGEPITILHATDHKTITPATQVLIQACARPASEARRAVDGLGHCRVAPRQEGAAGPGRLEHLRHHHGRVDSSNPIAHTWIGMACDKACSAGRATPRSRSCARTGPSRQTTRRTSRSRSNCRRAPSSRWSYISFAQWDARSPTAPTGLGGHRAEHRPVVPLEHRQEVRPHDRLHPAPSACDHPRHGGRGAVRLPPAAPDAGRSRLRSSPATTRPPQEIDGVRSKLGLDRPIWEQFGVCLGDMLHGDLGTSIFSNLPVSQLDRAAARADRRHSPLSTLMVAVSPRHSDGRAGRLEGAQADRPSRHGLFRARLRRAGIPGRLPAHLRVCGQAAAGCRFRAIGRSREGLWPWAEA